MIIRRVVRKVAPQVDPWSARYVAIAALAELQRAGLLDQRATYE
jgi:hypothetical protein